MERSEVISSTAMNTGSLVACSSAPAALVSESTMLFIFSALGAIVAAAGLIYTIWNGNRNYNLARQQMELRRLELLTHGIQPQQQNQPLSEST